MRAVLHKILHILKRIFQTGLVLWLIYVVAFLSYNIYMKVSPFVYRPYIIVGSMGETDNYVNFVSYSSPGRPDYDSYSDNENFSHFMELPDHSILKINNSWGDSISRQTSDGEWHLIYNYEENYPFGWCLYSVPHFYQKDNKLIAVVCNTYQYMWATFQKAPLEYSLPLIAAAPTYVFVTDLDTLKTEQIFTSEKGTRILYADTQQAVVLSKDNLQLIDMKSNQAIQTFDSSFFVSDEYYITEVIGNTLYIYHNNHGLIATMEVDDKCELKIMK